MGAWQVLKNSFNLIDLYLILICPWDLNPIWPRILQLKFSQNPLCSRMLSYCQKMIKLLKIVSFCVKNDSKKKIWKFDHAITSYGILRPPSAVWGMWSSCTPTGQIGLKEMKVVLRQDRYQVWIWAPNFLNEMFVHERL